MGLLRLLENPDDDARRKWAQGYQVFHAVHATSAEFNTFDPAFIGRLDPGWMGEGFYFQPLTQKFKDQHSRPGGGYAFGQLIRYQAVGGAQLNPGARNMPVLIRMKKPFTDQDAQSPHIAWEFHRRGYKSVHYHAGTAEPWEVKPPGQRQDFSYRRTRDDFHSDVPEDAKKFTEIAMELGYDGAIWHGEIVVFPAFAKNIRAMYGAKFSPEMADSPNILEGVHDEPLLVNPSRIEVLKLLKESYGVARMVMHEGNVYLWEGQTMRMLHGDVCNRIGITQPSSEMERYSMYAFANLFGVRYRWDGRWNEVIPEFTELARNNPNIVRIWGRKAVCINIKGEPEGPISEPATPSEPIKEGFNDSTPALREFYTWYEKEAKASAFVRLTQQTPDSVLILRAIGTKPGSIKQGIARDIMKRILQIANKFGLPVELEADETTESSDWLVDWYTRLGFVITGKKGSWGPVMRREPSAGKPMVENVMPMPQIFYHGTNIIAAARIIIDNALVAEHPVDDNGFACVCVSTDPATGEDFAINYARFNSELDVGAVFALSAPKVLKAYGGEPYAAETASRDEFEYRIPGTIAPLKSFLVGVRLVGEVDILRDSDALYAIWEQKPRYVYLEWKKFEQACRTLMQMHKP